MDKKVITIIGSGNVATHMAKALQAVGHQILQVWSREFDHAERLAYSVFAEPVDKLTLLYPSADVYILAVSDDALFDMALDLRFRDALVLHTSGSVPARVLYPISRRYGVIWSPQTFVRDVEMAYSELPFCIEGSSIKVRDEIKDLLREVSPHLYELDEMQRQWLHLAAVMVSNFGNAINATAQHLLSQRGIPFETLFPIIRMTASKAEHEVDLWRLQTGPAMRRDTKTMDRQRKMIADDARLLHLYDLMSELITIGACNHETH